MSRSAEAHNQEIERRARQGDADGLDSYHRFMNRMGRLELAGRLDKATDVERASYANNLACLLPETQETR